MTDHNAVIKDVGIFGLKTLVALNSGAVIVLLAFLGNISGNKTGSIDIDIGSIKTSMILFFVGICFSLISIVTTYILSQYHDNSRIENMKPFCFISIMLVPALLSFVFFSLGFIRAIQSFT